jgi:hypothetical protein
MLKPPLPITKTFLTSTGFEAPFITPLSRYAFAFGAVCDWLLRFVELENSREYLLCLPAGVWLLAYRHRVEARVVKVLEALRGRAV